MRNKTAATRTHFEKGEMAGVFGAGADGKVHGGNRGGRKAGGKSDAAPAGAALQEWVGTKGREQAIEDFDLPPLCRPLLTLQRVVQEEKQPCHKDCAGMHRR